MGTCFFVDATNYLLAEALFYKRRITFMPIEAAMANTRKTILNLICARNFFTDNIAANTDCADNDFGSGWQVGATICF